MNRKKLCEDMAVLRRAIVLDALLCRSFVWRSAHDDYWHYYERMRLATFRQVLRMINYRRKLP
jgi:hypothetical protein